jgi:hypothetical protein
METTQSNPLLKYITYMLRVGIACIFIGHGMNAIAIKQNWIPLLTVYGFSVEQATMVMPWIGILDIVVALLVLIHPFRAVVVWAIFWTFVTALTRLIAGEGIWEFIERAGNWSAPLALFLISKMETSHQQVKSMTPSNIRKEETTLILAFKNFLFSLLL